MAFNTKVDVADTELEENEAAVADAEDVTLEDEDLVEVESDVDEDDEEAEAYILKDVSDSADPEAAYEFVEDDEELEGVSKIFAELLEDIDIE